MLKRVELPGSHHTAVLLGCVEQSEAESADNNYRNTPTEGKILCLKRVESPGSQHTAVLLGSLEARCPRRYSFGASGG